MRRVLRRALFLGRLSPSKERRCERNGGISPRSLVAERLTRKPTSRVNRSLQRRSGQCARWRECYRGDPATPVPLRDTMKGLPIAVLVNLS